MQKIRNDYVYLSWSSTKNWFLCNINSNYFRHKIWRLAFLLGYQTRCKKRNSQNFELLYEGYLRPKHHYLLHSVIMLNPALTKELIKDKGNKYSTFLYCRFYNTIVWLHDSKLSLLSHFWSLDGQFLIRALQIRLYITNSMKKNTASKNQTNSGVIKHKTQTKYI